MDGWGYFFYIAAFDIIYSCQDYDFDKETGLHSLPVRLGIITALIISYFNHFLSLTFFIAAGKYNKASNIYYICLLFIAILFIYQHILARPKKLKILPSSFYFSNSIVSVILFFRGGIR